MSKVDLILENSAHRGQPRRKSGLLNNRARVMLLTLTTLLVAFVFLTQPQVRDAVTSLLP